MTHTEYERDLQQGYDLGLAVGQEARDELASLVTSAQAAGALAAEQAEQYKAVADELYTALVAYEWGAEGEAPVKHRNMMRNAFAALHPELPQ